MLYDEDEFPRQECPGCGRRSLMYLPRIKKWFCPRCLHTVNLSIVESLDPADGFLYGGFVLTPGV